MNTEKFQFLSLRHLPGRLTVEETAWFMGFLPHEIPKLTKAKMLPPLGEPGPTSAKVYCLTRLRRLKENEPWMHKASVVVHKFWRDRNRGIKVKKRRKP
jgi:hypothetical protein